MLGVSDFIEAFESEVGAELDKLVSPQEILRWVNRGQSRLGVYLPKITTVNWIAGAQSVTLPTDFHHPEKLTFPAGSVPESYEWFGNTLLLIDTYVLAGSAKLRYWATYPKITSSQDSLLSDVGDDALISYSLYRFYKRLASSRADYRRYATLTAQNGVDISELDALSERHFNDFDDVRTDLQESVHSPSLFFGE